MTIWRLFLFILLPTFIHADSTIWFIKKSKPVIIATTSDHNLVDGQMVRIEIPMDMGMQELNGFMGYVTVISKYEFSLRFDARCCDDFFNDYMPASSWSYASVIILRSKL